MPIYTFENTKTGKVYDDMMSIAEKETFLKKNKHIKQRLTSQIYLAVLWVSI